MKEQRVVQILQGIAEDEVPATLDLWPEIQARVQPQRCPLLWTRLMPTTRLGWAGLITALLLAFSAGAYAVAPLLSQAFQMEAGLYHIEQANLSQEVNLSQTVDGITVTLERVYADANRIVVGYTVNGSTDMPDNRNLFPAQVTLTDEQGIVFPAIGGVGRFIPVGPGAEAAEAWTGGFVASFDAAVVQGAHEALHLCLVMDVETYVVPTPMPPTPDVYEDRGSPDPIVPVTTAGPFTFDFSVSFTPGHALEVQQTVEAAGVAVKLERVVITPSETRAYLCFDPPDGESEDWWPTVSWSTAGGQIYGAGPGFHDQQVVTLGSARTMVNRNGEGRYSCSVLASLDDQSGEWTLTVTELGQGEQTRLAGPWVFHFRVP